MTNLVQYNIFKFHNKFFDRFGDDIEGVSNFIRPLKFDKESVDRSAPNLNRYFDCTDFKLFDNLFITMGSYGNYRKRIVKSNHMVIISKTDKCIKFCFFNSGDISIFFSYSKDYSFISYSDTKTYITSSYNIEPTITATRSYKFDEDKILEKTLKSDIVNFFVPEYIVNLL